MASATLGLALSCQLLPPAFAQTIAQVPDSRMAAPSADVTPDAGAGAASLASAGAANAGPVPEAGNSAISNLVRVTSSFEVTHAAAVLRQVARLFSAGFVRRDAEQVARMIDALAAEQSRTWDFNATRKGVSYPLRVRARIDEFGMLDLDFFTAPAMASPVRGAVDGYLNARGL